MKAIKKITIALSIMALILFSGCSSKQVLEVKVIAQTESGIHQWCESNTGTKILCSSRIPNDDSYYYCEVGTSLGGATVCF